MVSGETSTEPFWKGAPAEGLQFDSYYQKREPSEILRMGSGSLPGR